MAKIVYGMNQSLDGYVDHTEFGPDDVLFQHWINHMQGISGCLYGRKLYEIMRYWDDEQPEWTEAEREFGKAWRGQHKWVVSTTLSSVGPNTTLISENVETAVRDLKDITDGEIEVGGPDLAGSLTEAGLIDEYRFYFHPVVLGHGTPFFSGPRPRLRFVSQHQIGKDVICLTYVPA